MSAYSRCLYTKVILKTQYKLQAKPWRTQDQLIAPLPQAECRSTERGSQGFVQFLRSCIVLSETIENRTLIHMNFFQQHGMTNQFPEGMTFFMNHPVYVIDNRLNIQHHRELVYNNFWKLYRNRMNGVCSYKATPGTPVSIIFTFFKLPKPPRACFQ